MKEVLSIIVLSLMIYSCANIGTLSGGEKDITPPEVIMCTPNNYSINIEPINIVIEFNEYIELSNMQSQMFVSPPLESPEFILKGKKLYLTMNDTSILENTTYTIHFGNAISDLNENNELLDFKYVFSTGQDIDSLQIKGVSLDAYSNQFLPDILVMLYEESRMGIDSLPYLKKPNYFTFSNDSGSFTISNIKAGNYKLIGLEDINYNYTFEEQTEKIGFFPHLIIPEDSEKMNLFLFKEDEEPKFLNSEIQENGSVAFAFSHNAKEFSIISLVEEKGSIWLEEKKDTLFYWPKNLIKDSIDFLISKKLDLDTIRVFYDILYNNKLEIKLKNKLLHPNDSLILSTNSPVQFIDYKKITLFYRDSIELALTSNTIRDPLNPILSFQRGESSEEFFLTLFPGALHSIYNESNEDTLHFNFTTKNKIDYGDLFFHLTFTKPTNYIFQLFNSNDVLIKELHESDKINIEFKNLYPGTYNARIIIDSNGNKKWDTGKYLQNNLAEKIYDYQEDLVIRSNWEIKNSWKINVN